MVAMKDRCAARRENSGIAHMNDLRDQGPEGSRWRASRRSATIATASLILKIIHEHSPVKKQSQMFPRGCERRRSQAIAGLCAPAYRRARNAKAQGWKRPLRDLVPEQPVAGDQQELKGSSHGRFTRHACWDTY